MPDFTSPNTGNYQIAKGNVWFTPSGGTRRHLGNCPAAQFTPNVEKLDHFSSMAGIRSKDFSATLSKEATIALTLEEITLENLKLALLGGDITPNTEGDLSFEIGSADAITGLLEIIGTNDVGPKYTYEFYQVTFTPSNAVDFIGEEYSAIEIEGEVLAVNGSFGRATLQDSATA